MALAVMDLRAALKCLSTDTKPDAPSSLLLYEVDTGAWYVWNGSAWVAYSGA